MTTFKIELTFENKEYAENMLDYLTDDMGEVCPRLSYELHLNQVEYLA
tara:strand:+ start:1117 stop:1260 length:144 start_codon:yes stop_codon:yes gene_type:complete